MLRRLDRLRIHSDHGFTMLETTLVVIVIGLIAVLAIPRLVPTDKRVAYATYHQMTADMRYTRTLAITNSADYEFVLTPSGGPYTGYIIRPTGGSTIKTVIFPVNKEFQKNITCNLTTGTSFTETLRFTRLGNIDNSSVNSDETIIDIDVGGYLEQVKVIKATGRIY